MLLKFIFLVIFPLKNSQRSLISYHKLLNMSGSLGKLGKYFISNVHHHLDRDRVIEQKKFQMSNQAEFQKIDGKSLTGKTYLERNEVLF